ncbi:MAG: prolipoprotein diacylglyceryl transferase, partial [Candidatus Subteraquimicrobiales bacterium]|nr:prolipoprotein diacylglyceryl transferase [Candidatus Subteraquimicrobiales bacterium]
MHPILFKWGPITVYSYGFMLAIAFLVGILIARSEARRKRINPDLTFDLAILAAVGGIVGARLFYVIGHWELFLRNWKAIFAFQEGGLVFYGGLAGGAIAILVYISKKKLSIAETADLIAPSLTIGYSIARIGCFLNGCCYGRETKVFLSVNFPGVEGLRHPTQIYSSLYGLVIFGILWGLRKKLTRSGQLFSLYLLLYALARFIVEFFRDTRPFFAGLSIYQVLSLGLISGVIVFNLSRRF